MERLVGLIADAPLQQRTIALQLASHGLRVGGITPVADLHISLVHNVQLGRALGRRQLLVDAAAEAQAKMIAEQTPLAQVCVWLALAGYFAVDGDPAALDIGRKRAA